MSNESPKMRCFPFSNLFLTQLSGRIDYLCVCVCVFKKGETVIGNHLEGGNEAPHQSHGIR